jgi:ABC-2 type transport system permease protein
MDLSVPVKAPGFFGSIRKYLNILKVSLVERLAYRGDFLLGTVLRFLPMISAILLWKSVYLGADTDVLSGYTYSQVIAYLLLVHVSRMFSSMPGLAAGVARDIRDGNLKRYLIQPLDLMSYLLAYRAAHKMAYIATSALPYAGLFIVCAGYFETLPSLATIGFWLLSLLLGFLLGFFFELTLGMLGFWMLEVTSFLYLVNTLNFFVSGHFFPIDLMEPAGLVVFLKMLPFQYLAYFPAAIFLGKIPPDQLLPMLGVQLLWVLFFALVSRILWRLGLRRYSAFGG